MRRACGNTMKPLTKNNRQSNPAKGVGYLFHLMAASLPIELSEHETLTQYWRPVRLQRLSNSELTFG